jgi:hypothetical protein
MEPPRATATTTKFYGPERSRGYGFEIEKPLSGMAASQWVPVLELVYKTEAEANTAREAIGRILNDVVHIEGKTSDA